MFGKKKKKQEKDAAPDNEASEPASSGGGLPEELAPKDLPKPDGLKKLPPSRMEPGGSNKSFLRTKKAKKSGDKKGGCGCLVIPSLIVLIPVGLIAVTVMLSISQFEKAGYVRQSAGTIQITEPPTEKTLYAAVSINGGEHVTTVEVAYAAAVVELSGVYKEDVYVRAINLHCGPDTVFEKNLEVFAGSYHNEGKINGELKGRIIRQKGLPEPAPE